MTLTTKHVVRVVTSIGITVVLTLVLWPLVQGQSVTALAVTGGVATSSLIEDRIGGHGLHWGGALASGAICGLMCYVGLRVLMP